MFASFKLYRCYCRQWGMLYSDLNRTCRDKKLYISPILIITTIITCFIIIIIVIVIVIVIIIIIIIIIITTLGLSILSIIWLLAEFLLAWSTSLTRSTFELMVDPHWDRKDDCQESSSLSGVIIVIISTTSSSCHFYDHDQQWGEPRVWSLILS